MSRRVPLALAVIIGLVALVVVGLDRPAPLSPVFTQLGAPTTPFVPDGSQITSTWYCAGVPAVGATSAGEVGGEIIVSNPTESPLTCRVTLLSPEQQPIVQTVIVAARDTTTVDVDEVLTAPFVGAVVELDAGVGIVEQRAIHPAGDAVSTCSNAPSSSWYFADGFTVDGSVQNLVLTNPFTAPAIVDIGFVTVQGGRSPTAFQGFVLPARSVRIIDLAQVGVRDEPLLAVKVEATRGRFVAGRSQHFLGGGRLGYTMSLGAPSLDDQWWFADGETGEGITETYLLYNPTENDVEADVVVLGLPFDAVDASGQPIEAITVTVPSDEVVSFDMSGIGLPTGRHGVVVSTLTADALVVERVLTRPAGDSVATSVVLGSQSSAVASTWHLPVGVDQDLEQAVVVLNVSFGEGTVTVNAVGPGGIQPVPGYEALVIPPNGVLAIDLAGPDVIGRELVITSDVLTVVERRLARGGDLRGRSGSLAVPQYWTS